MFALDPTITYAESVESAQSMLILYGHYTSNGRRDSGHAACAISNGDGTFAFYNAIGVNSTQAVDIYSYYTWFSQTDVNGWEIEEIRFFK